MAVLAASRRRHPQPEPRISDGSPPPPTRVALPHGVPVPPAASRKVSGWSGATGAVAPPAGWKLVHFVRHAQGFHNVSELPIAQRPLDARLTPAGMEQCAALQATTSALRPALVVSSTLTRTLQTATLCFEPQRRESGAPLLALEEVRETVNFLCDCRRKLSEIAPEFLHADFSMCGGLDADEIWATYEARHGPAEAYAGHRELADLPALTDRWRRAAAWLAARPEQEVVVVSHCAFLQAIFGKIDGQQGRPGPLFDFGGDRDLEAWMATSFCNCEMRSVLLQLPTSSAE